MLPRALRFALAFLVALLPQASASRSHSLTLCDLDGTTESVSDSRALVIRLAILVAYEYWTIHLIFNFIYSNGKYRSSSCVPILKCILLNVLVVMNYQNVPSYLLVFLKRFDDFGAYEIYNFAKMFDRMKN